jgi:hypothetical protein
MAALGQAFSSSTPYSVHRYDHGWADKDKWSRAQADSGLTLERVADITLGART